MILYDGYTKPKRLVDVFNNYNRKFDPFEEAEELKQLNAKYTHRQIAKMFGMTSAAVTKKIGLLELDEEVKEMIRRGAIPMSAGYVLEAVAKHDQMQIVMYAIKNSKSQRRASEREIKKAKKRFYY